MSRVVTAALLARKVDFGEADRICTLLTRARGRISAVARAARRSRKRYGGALSLFVIGQATLAPARRGDLLQLERFDVDEDLAGAMGMDIVKVAHGSYIVELARELWPPGQPEPEAFDLTCDVLRVLATGAPSASLLRCFELSLLRLMGLAPVLDRCVECGAAPGEGARYSAVRGGVVCAGCGSAGAAGEVPLPPAAREGLQWLGAAPPARAAVYASSRSATRQMREAMHGTVRHHVGKELRSLEFLLQLGRAGR